MLCIIIIIITIIITIIDYSSMPMQDCAGMLARIQRRVNKGWKRSHSDTWRPMSFWRETFSHRGFELAKYFLIWSPGNLLYSPNVNSGPFVSIRAVSTILSTTFPTCLTNLSWVPCLSNSDTWLVDVDSAHLYFSSLSDIFFARCCGPKMWTNFPAVRPRGQINPDDGHIHVHTE